MATVRGDEMRLSRRHVLFATVSETCKAKNANYHARVLVIANGSAVISTNKLAFAKYRRRFQTQIIDSGDKTTLYPNRFTAKLNRTT
ncbi:MAG: hypothetical protein LBT96_01235 [Campylobacteraceae bacterium]|nr:hypothetical protein [Campylobacteraceae bacterium]